MTDEELRKDALGLAAFWIKGNVEAGVLDDMGNPDQAALERLLLQLADELEGMAKKPARRRPAQPKEDPPFSLQVTRTDGGGEHPSRYKTYGRARAAAVGLIERENADPANRNPAQRVWVFEGAEVRICYALGDGGRAVIDREAHRNIGVEAPQVAGP